MLYVLVGVVCGVAGYWLGWRAGNMIGLKCGEHLTHLKAVAEASKGDK